jgi:hypothetical protein
LPALTGQAATVLRSQDLEPVAQQKRLTMQSHVDQFDMHAHAPHCFQQGWLYMMRLRAPRTSRRRQCWSMRYGQMCSATLVGKLRDASCQCFSSIRVGLLSHRHQSQLSGQLLPAGYMCSAGPSEVSILTASPVMLGCMSKQRMRTKHARRHLPYTKQACSEAAMPLVYK